MLGNPQDAPPAMILTVLLVVLTWGKIKLLQFMTGRDLYDVQWWLVPLFFATSSAILSLTFLEGRFLFQLLFYAAVGLWAMRRFQIRF